MPKIKLSQILEPVDWDKGYPHMDGVEKRNWETLQEFDKQAKALGAIQGRYIQMPQADGYAIYMITDQKKTTVTIEVCTGLGDDWVNPIWGHKASIKIADAQKFINRRDGLAALFGGK